MEFLLRILGNPEASAILIVTIAAAALTHRSSVGQRRRELDMSTVQEFHVCYGEFFAVWTLWNSHIEQAQKRPETRAQLLARISSAEGGLESILSRLAANRRMSRTQLADLASFRQAYRRLRHCITDGAPLGWDRSDNADYASFKALSVAVSQFIHSRTFVVISVARHDAWLIATDNCWEQIWAAPTCERLKLAARLLRSRETTS